MSSDLDSLIFALNGGNPNMRRSDAAIALGNLRDRRAVSALISALQRDRNVLVREFSAEALGKIGDARAIGPLIAALQSAEPGVRIYAAEALGRFDDASAVETLISILQKSQYIDERSTIINVLGRIGGAKAVMPLISALRIKSGQELGVRSSAVDALISIGIPAIEPLKSTLNDNDPEIRGVIVEILGKIGSSLAFAELVRALLDGNLKVRERAAVALGEIGDERAIPILERVIEDHAAGTSSYSVVQAARASIGNIRAKMAG